MIFYPDDIYCQWCKHRRNQRFALHDRALPVISRWNQRFICIFDNVLIFNYGIRPVRKVQDLSHQKARVQESSNHHHTRPDKSLFWFPGWIFERPSSLSPSLQRYPQLPSGPSPVFQIHIDIA